MDQPTTSLGTILSIWAHPDDETYLAGGLMAAAAANGHRVVCVSATAGELGTDDPDRWAPERLGMVRQLEAAAAMAVLGVTEHRFLGLPDGGLADHEAKGAAIVSAVLEEVQPDTILTFGRDGMTFHEDHRAIHRWVTKAWEASGGATRLLHATWTSERLARFGPMYEAGGVFMSDLRPVGVPAARCSLRLQVGGAALDRKLAALRAMATQTAPAIAAIGEAAYAELVAEECFVDARAN